MLERKMAAEVMVVEEGEEEILVVREVLGQRRALQLVAQVVLPEMELPVEQQG